MDEPIDVSKAFPIYWALSRCPHCMDLIKESDDPVLAKVHGHFVLLHSECLALIRQEHGI